MFCSNCGKDIPSESRFCMFCGNSQTNYQKNQSQPFYIKSAFVHAHGPVDEKPGKGLLSQSLIGRWLSFGFVLGDQSFLPTSANGEVVIAINKWGDLGPLKGYRSFDELKRKATFFGEFSVNIDSFKDDNLETYFLYNDQFVYFESIGYYAARIGFRTQTEQLLEYPRILKTISQANFRNSIISFYE